jgi:hypothetical protein
VENVGKRVRKAPKIYLRDSGVFHALMNLCTMAELQSHPKLGASWEGLALEHVLRVLKVSAGEAFCWATHAGAELDLLVVRGGKRFGFEFKFGDAPRTSKSMHVALPDLHLAHLFVIHPGEKDFQMDDRISALGLARVARAVALMDSATSPPGP